MALIVKDRVKESAPAPGTGAISLAGALTGYQAFSAAIGNGNTVYYAITDGAAKWETGLGTYASSGNTLTRTTVLASSNSGSAENFTSTITVWGDAPAAQLPLLAASFPSGALTITDASGSASNPTSVVARYQKSPGMMNVWGSFVPTPNDGNVAKYTWSIFPSLTSSIGQGWQGVVSFGGGGGLPGGADLVETYVQSNSSNVVFFSGGGGGFLNSDIFGYSLNFSASYPTPT